MRDGGGGGMWRWVLGWQELVRELRGFDVAHVWYGGGSLRGRDGGPSLQTFASHVAAVAGVPAVQNLAWNVFTVDLSVAVVVVRPRLNPKP